MDLDPPVLRLGPVIVAGDVPGLCDRVREALAEPGAVVVICDVGAVTRVDSVTIDALARLQLAAQRLGGQIRVRGAGTHLALLLAFAGLAAVIPCEPP